MRIAWIALVGLWASTASAQGLAPDVTYDPAIPTLKAVIGHEPGEAITTPDEIGRYLEALAKAAPKRTRLVKYATSWEGRPLHYLIVGSPQRVGKLEEIRKGIQAVASGAADADRLITTAATAARNRERLLRDFLEYRRSAIALGQTGTRAYLIPPGPDPKRAHRLARLPSSRLPRIRTTGRSPQPQSYCSSTPYCWVRDTDGKAERRKGGRAEGRKVGRAERVADILR